MAEDDFSSSLSSLFQKALKRKKKKTPMMDYEDEENPQIRIQMPESHYNVDAFNEEMSRRFWEMVRQRKAQTLEGVNKVLARAKLQYPPD